MISAVCGYYGKLPISPEFLRLRAAGPELRWLDDWLQKGILYAKATEGPRWPTLVAESDLWNFMYVPSGHGRIVCGVLFASQDKAGRSFPFLTFFLLEGESLVTSLWLVPILAGVFLEAVTKSLQLLRKHLDWNKFCRDLEAVGERSINVGPVAEAFGQYLRSTNTKEWWVSLWGTFDEPRKYRLEQGLRAVIRSSKQHMNGKIPWGIKFPLFAGTVLGKYDLPFWLAASLQSVGRGRPHELGVFSFWNRSPTKVEPCALVSIGPGSPHMTRFIVSPEAQDDAWRDVLSSEQTSDGPGETLGHDGNGVLSDPALSLERLLEYFSGIG